MVTTSATARSAPFDMVVVAASFGGLAALRQLTARLPADFPVPIALVFHRPVTPDLVPDILRRDAALPIHELTSDAAGVVLAPGVHVAAPHTRYARSVGGCWHAAGASIRPADDLMTSAVNAYGARTCAIVLTGKLNDGSRGVRAVKRSGGYVIVQDPTSARASGMPRAAMATGCADLVLPLDVIAPALVALTMAPGVIEMFPRAPRPWADLSAV